MVFFCVMVDVFGKDLSFFRIKICFQISLILGDIATPNRPFVPFLFHRQARVDETAK